MTSLDEAANDGHRLTALLGAVHAVNTVDEAAWTIVEWVAEAIEAEIVSLRALGETVASLGGMSEAPTETFAIPGVEGGHLLVGRLGEGGITAAERNVLRGVVRVTGLVLRLLLAAEQQAVLREEASKAALRSEEMAGAVRQRNTFIESVLDIQRAITRGDDVHQILDAVVDAVVRLVGSGLSVTLRLLDADDQEQTSIVASSGVDPMLLTLLSRRSIEVGSSGRAIRERRLVVDEDYAAVPHAHPELVDFGHRAAMSAPIIANDRALGAITVASTQTGRVFTEGERANLVALADQAALGLVDAQAEQRMREALVDTLTGLPNRSLLMDRIEQALARARRDTEHCCLIFIDLDRFKMVNDSLGHAAGDVLLQEAARRLKATLREVDTCARLGGDEFAILLPGTEAERADRIARRVLSTLRKPFEIEGRIITIGASLGVAESRPEVTPAELVRNADLAMYEAKRSASGSVARFAPIMHAAALNALELRAELEAALLAGSLHVAYQPLFDLGTGQVVGAEALVRWDHAERGVINPIDFVPLAEETGLIIGLGHFVLERALADLAIWREASGRDLYISINAAPAQFLDPMFVPSIEAALRIHRIPASALLVEVTENSLMSDVGPSVERARQLRGRGVRLAIDDFGTGYSSLTYLRTFDFDVLKMDRAFMAQKPNDDWSLVRTILELCSSLGITAVSEGIEHEWQRLRVAEFGCDLGQGFHLGRPVSSEVFRQTWLTPAADVSA